MYLLLEYAPGGTLLDLMRRRGGARLDEAEAARRVARPLLSALAYLHGQGLIHRRAPGGCVGMREGLVSRGVVRMSAASVCQRAP